MSDLKTDLKSFIKGDIDASDEAKQFFSHDASMFEMVPEIVVSPKDSKDIQELVKYVAKNKHSNPSLSLTARSGGTCMSGGAINDSIIILKLL